MATKVSKLFLLFLILPILLAACSFPWKKTPAPVSVGTPGAPEETAASSSPAALTDGSSQLKKFNDYGELAVWLADNSNPESLQLQTFGRTGLMADGAIEKSLSLATPSEGATAGAPVYSGTNNQVAGVDEADIIKTDGNYIYALVRNELLIIKASPALTAAVVSKITFKSRPQDIFIHGKSLAVFGADEQIYGEAFYRTFRRQNSYTFFKVFDISDPANPRPTRDLDFEGQYYGARLVGDYVYFLTTSYGSYLAGEPLVPRLLENGQPLPQQCDGTVKCYLPEVYYFDIPYDSYNFTSITAINLADSGEAVSGDIYLLNNGQNLYVSSQNIYISYTQYLNEYDVEQLVKRELVYPRLSPAEQEKIKAIEASPAYVLNIHEKKIKVAQVIDRYLGSLGAEQEKAVAIEIDDALEKKMLEKAAELERTIIHKIAISGRNLEYRAMGEVPGQLLNQFSMDESGDYFRLATTRNPQWSRLGSEPAASYNNLYVLDTNLKITGRLENLATDERIYAVRFFPKRAYIVTFKQTDPLFVISLADPAKPVVLNSIKLPGFSNYLHPADREGNILIGLGRDSEEAADGGVKIKGLKVSLFDFSDTSKPKELDTYIVGDSSSDSIALNDHRAFLYSAEKDVLSFPAVLRENGRLNFAGSLVFSLAGKRFDLKGRIDHSAGGRFTQSDYWQGYDYYDNTVKRSLYINDNLFTFSNKFLKINSLADLAEVKSLELTASDEYIITPLPPQENPEPETGSTTPPIVPEATSTPPANL